MAGALFDLTGRVAMVTGGNRGIGFGMAHALVTYGASVLIAGRDEEKNRVALDQLLAIGGRAHAVTLDVTDEQAAARAVERCVGHFGRLDILVNNAGINIRKGPAEASLAEWQAVLDTNLTGSFLMARAAHPHLKAHGAGKVINVGSMMSLFGAALLPAYAASKAGIVQLTKSQACAWAGDGIQANAILPGWIDTDLLSSARREIPTLHDRVVARTPAGRLGTPSDLTGVTVFLASSASDFVTGTAIPVDGGFSAQG